MIGYVMVGTNDLEKACEFYDKVLEPLGAKRLMDLGRSVLWGTDMKSPMFSVTTPFDEQAASVGNGTMVALMASSKEVVDAVHAAVLAAGGTDEGEPGPRGDPEMGFYGGYFRDLDGNKLNAFVIG